MNPDATEVTGNRATRRAAARRGRKLAALGSGAVLATGVAAGAVASFAPSAGAATTITVQNTNDSGAGSLREALANANAGDTIDLTGLSGTITLTSGQLEVEDAVTVQGPGASALAISGNNASRVFYLHTDLAGGTFTISGLTITGGNDGPGGGVYFDCDEGGGSFVVTDSVVTGNVSDDLGGGLYFDECNDGGSMTVVNSVVSNNISTDNSAGGIWFDEGDTLTIQNSTVSNNQGQEGGGGGVTAFAYDGVTVLNSTISGNTAADGSGGGMYLWTDDGTFLIANSTISDNHATNGNGGGIAFMRGEAQILQSTISGNTAADNGDGLYVGYAVESALSQSRGRQAENPHIAATDHRGQVLLDVDGTIVSGNAEGTDDIFGDPQSDSTLALTASVIGTVNGLTPTDHGGNQTGVTNPGLAALANNGGITQTQALLPGSPAIDLGPDPVPPFSGNEFDQRGPGFARVVGAKVDVGAFEVQAPAPAPEVIITPRFTG